MIKFRIIIFLLYCFQKIFKRKKNTEDMIGNFNKEQEYLIHAIPIMYYIQAISLKYELVVLIVIILYGFSTAMQMVNVQALKMNIKELKEQKIKPTSEHFKKFFTEKPYRTTLGLFQVLMGFATLIIMIMLPKNFFVWSLIVTYCIGLTYQAGSFILIPKYNRNVKGITNSFKNLIR